MMSDAWSLCKVHTSCFYKYHLWDAAFEWFLCTLFIYGGQSPACGYVQATKAWLFFHCFWAPSACCCSLYLFAELLLLSDESSCGRRWKVHLVKYQILTHLYFFILCYFILQLRVISGGNILFMSFIWNLLHRLRFCKTLMFLKVRRFLKRIKNRKSKSNKSLK